jgi:hypothetical protein
MSLISFFASFMACLKAGRNALFFIFENGAVPNGVLKGV